MSTVTVTQTRPSVPAAAAAPTAVSKPAGPTPAHLLIDDKWYDLTHWKKHHPGGALIIEQMHGNDATDAFYSLHSKEAIARLKRLPSSSAVPACLKESPPPPPTAATLAFRKFRAQLEADGWLERSLVWELFYALSVYGLAAAGTYACFSGYKVLAVVLLGFAMQQGGWVGHDHTHGRGDGCLWTGYGISGLINAFSRSWWSNKHNTHHVFTNYIGVDVDIENDPIFHLFFPDEDKDVFFRKMQHWYFVPVAALLFASWRNQSMQTAVAQRNWMELTLMAINYAWLYSLGLWVSLGAIYLSGMLVAVIVTATHQSEEMIDPAVHDAAAKAGAATVQASVVDMQVPSTYSFVEGQFATTRDARTSDFFTEWMWGGMQYQLEHHLFPIIPKYYYPKLAPLVEQFAKENGLSYRADTQWDIFCRNFNTLKKFAGNKEQQHNSKKAQ